MVTQTATLYTRAELKSISADRMLSWMMLQQQGISSGSSPGRQTQESKAKVDTKWTKPGELEVF